MKLMIKMLVGAIIGFFTMYSIMSVGDSFRFPSIAFEANIIFLVIVALMLLFVGVSMVQMLRKAKLVLTGEEEDERDVWQYKRFSDTNLCVTIALVVGISALAVSVITDQPMWIMNASIIGALVPIISSLITASIINKIYPERALPTVSESNYANKLLAVADEGERFVMLQGLYRTFNMLNAGLIIALFLLIAYSTSTGDSQLFSILIVGTLLIGANAQYFLAIRNKT